MDARTSPILLSIDELREFYYPERLSTAAGILFQTTLGYSKFMSQTTLQSPDKNWNMMDAIRPNIILGRILESNLNQLPDGVTAVFSLVSYGEFAAAAFPFDELKKRNIKHFHIPMTDFTNRVNINVVINAIYAACETLDADEKIYIHCKAGRSRSGMYSGVLISYREKISLNDSLDDIARYRKQLSVEKNKRETGETILAALHAMEQQAAQSEQPTALHDTHYLASLQGKNDIIHLISFKKLATYLANLSDTQYRAQQLQAFFAEILTSTDASWYDRWDGKETSLAKFLQAAPILRADDTPTRRALVDAFKVELDELVLGCEPVCTEARVTVRC